MKPFSFLLGLLLLSSLTTKAQKRVSYTAQDSGRIVTWLKQFQAQRPTGCLQLWFAQKFLGKPYVAGTLEHNKKERLVVNLQEVDCTTFLNQTLALTLTARKGKEKFQDFCSYLQQLRYSNGIIDEYPSRLHYYSQAIVNHTAKGLFRELGQTAVAKYPFTAVQTLHLNYMSTHPEKYKQLKGNKDFTQRIASQEKELEGKKIRYIPVVNLAHDEQLKSTIKDGDILAIVTKKQGLDTSHLGFAVWKNGHLHLLNASSIHKKVVLESMTLYQYMRKHPSQLGIRVIRLL